MTHPGVQVTIVGDSAAALLLGLAAGVFCYFANFSDTYLAWMAFSKEFFFYGVRSQQTCNKLAMFR